MTRDTTMGLRLWHLLVILSLCGATKARAQDGCDALVTRALNEFETARRIDLLVTALNPATCPPRGPWTVGVQLLAQTLIEDAKDSLATAWLRWATRLAPDLQPDSAQFLPRVITAFRSARAFAATTRVPRDTAVVTTWIWPSPGTTATQGGIQVANPSPSLRVAIEGVGLVGATGRTSLGPGSYRIAASGTDTDSLRVTREVLPGVTTVLEFHLVTRVARTVPPPTAPPPHTRAAKKGGIPTWVKIGAGGAVVWAILWNAYIKSH
jgi:hypothetical protein